jgi:hypothetical protein
MAWLFKFLLSIVIIGVGLYFNADRLENPLVWIIAVFFWGIWMKMIWSKEERD